MYVLFRITQIHPDNVGDEAKGEEGKDDEEEQESGHIHTYTEYHEN